MTNQKDTNLFYIGFKPDQWLGKAMKMGSTPARAAFLVLAAIYVTDQEALPADDDEELAAMAGMSVSEMKRAKKGLLRVFVIKGDRLCCPFLDDEIKYCKEKREQLSEASRIGNEAKKEKRRLREAANNA